MIRNQLGECVQIKQEEVFIKEEQNLSSDEESYSPPEVMNASETAIESSSLPKKSAKAYEAAYRSFMEWHERKKAVSFSQNVLMAYFEELAEKYKSSSLWTQYSMLRGTLKVYDKVDLDKYIKLKSFLKRKSSGYQAKKAKIFTPEEINRFIRTANDQKYLGTKVALIIGIVGACRCNEIKEMSMDDFQDLTSRMTVTVADKKTEKIRRFTITGDFYEIVKKYIALRPSNCATSAFFLNYQNGKCKKQAMGINKLSAMGKQIATFLNLPEPELYTGHSFRRSAKLLEDTGARVTSLETHGEWSSASTPTESSLSHSPSSTSKFTYILPAFVVYK